MNFVIKFQSPFERLKSTNLDPEVALRRSIILQAIIDASNISQDRQVRKITFEAKMWLFTDSKHFNQICIEADLKPNFVRKIAREIIQLHQNTQKHKLQQNKYYLHDKIIFK